MPYPALPDHRMPYDADGTLVYRGALPDGATNVLTSTQRLNLNLHDPAIVYTHPTANPVTFFFFPESREVTGCAARVNNSTAGQEISSMPIHGSADTANGVDGTWETASVTGTLPGSQTFDSWRGQIRPISFVGPKKSIRIIATKAAIGNAEYSWIHLYGEAAPAAMAHDLIFEEWDGSSWGTVTAPLDYGDQPLGTTVVRQIRIKNTSASRTATNINVQLNDSDFTMAENPAGPWVVTIGIPSLAPGAASNSIYVRLTTPAPGAALAPRFARMIVITDAGFFG